MFLECPYCKKKYHLDPSPFTGFKSARVRCRMCGKGFTIAFPSMEPTELPRQPQALTLPRGMPGIAFRSGADTHVSQVFPPEPSARSPVQSAGSSMDLVSEEPDMTILPCLPGAAGDTPSSPPSEAPPTYFLKAHKTPPGYFYNTSHSSLYWAPLVVPAIIVACFLSIIALIRFLSG